MHEEDQDTLRFLWWTNGYDNTPDTNIMQVHIFGAASSPCTAISTLSRVAVDNAKEYSSSVITALKDISMLTILFPLTIMNSPKHGRTACSRRI